ncbi:MAG: methyltransferase family protein [Burkholderiales bacterium]
MTRALAFLYGIGCYAFFFGVFLWLIAFVGDFTVTGVVTKTISHGAPAGGLGATMLDLVLLSLFGLQHSITDHFDLFGLRQVYLNLVRKTYTQVPFKTVFLYKFIRHPMMLGILIAFWAIPVMTLGHLVFSAGFTLYVSIGIHFEERGLLRELGPDYAAWRERTPMILPVGRG